MKKNTSAGLTGFFVGSLAVLFTWSIALNFLLTGSLEIVPPWLAVLFLYKHGGTPESGKVLWDSMMIQVRFYFFLQLPVWACYFFSVFRRRARLTSILRSRAELKGGH